MSEYSLERADIFNSFVRYRIASQKWNPVSANNLLYFDRYCSEHFPGVHGVTQEMITGWCMRRPTEIKNNSVIGRCTIAIQLIKYLLQRELCDIILPDMPKFRRSRRIPHAFEIEELTRFFKESDRLVVQESDKNKKFIYLSLSVLFRLLYSSGMRTTEVRLLDVSDVDLELGVINIRATKGDIQHYVALHDDTTEMLQKFNIIANRRYPGRSLFFPINGKRITEPLTADMLDYHFHRRWDKVNSAKAVPYDFRHNYAIENINRWIDEGYEFNDKFFYLSKSMGHTSLESTQYYYSLVPALAEVIKIKTEAGFNDICPEVPNYE